MTGADIDALCVGPGIHPVFTSFSEKLIAQKEVNAGGHAGSPYKC